MPFDPTTARPVGGGFDPTSAAPAQQPQAAPQAPQQDTGPQGMVQAAGDMLFTALHGAADTATFGLADKASAGLAHLISPATGQPMSYDEAYSKIQANNAARTGRNPVSAVVGDVAGMAAGAGGIVKAAGKIPVAARAMEALAPVANQPVRNVAKAALAAGAGSGALTAADGAIRNGEINPDSVITNTAVGAVVGPIASKVGTAIARGVQNSSTKAMQVLADKIGEPIAVLQRAYDNFSAATGRVPTMAEIVGMRSQGELKQLAANNPVVQEAVNTAADTSAAQRPRALAQAVENAGGPAQDINQLVQARTQRMTQAMDPIRNTPASITNSDTGLLNDPRVRQAIRPDPNLSQRVRDAIADADASGTTDMLTIDDIDSIRKSIRGRQSAFANPANSAHNPHMAEQFGNLADNIGALGTSSEPAYQDALDQFTRDSHYIAGFKHGNAGKTIGQADRADLIRALNEPEGVAGHQAGIVSRTGDAAAASPDSATRTAAQLAAGGGETANLRVAVGQPGFERVQAAADAENRGATALDTIRGSVNPVETGVKGAQVAQAVGAAGAHSPTGMLFHLSRVIPSFSKTLSPAVQRQVARYLADPSMTQQGINLLRRAGATDTELRKLAVALSANAGLNTAATLGQ
jgi:hypothetical protein